MRKTKRVFACVAIAALGASFLSGCSAIKEAADKVGDAVQSAGGDDGKKAGEFSIPIAETVDAEALTKPGTQLAIADAAVLGTNGKLDGSDDMVVTRGFTTNVSAVKGDIADLADVDLTGSETTSTPYYVTVTVAWQSGTEHSSLDYVSDLDFGMWNTDSSRAGKLKLILTGIGAEFPKCPEGNHFAHSPSHGSMTASDPATPTCMIFLVPQGKEAGTVGYFGGDYDENPVYWKL